MSAFGLRELLRECERRIVSALALRPVALDPQLASAAGSFKGVPPQPLYARVGADRRDEACAAALDRVDRFCALAAAGGPPGSEREISHAHREYARAHLEDDKGLAMLARMFGDAWAHRFLREVMFPAPPA